MDKKKFIEESLKESAETKISVINHCIDQIIEVSNKICDCIKKGNKLMLCGNGGSAADAQHIATEFMIRLAHDIQRPAMPAIALSTDCSNLTAGGNDIGFENIFMRNVEGIGKKGDILLGISTSGNSLNIIKAMRKAKEMGITRICLLGMGGGKLINECDYYILIPSNNVQRIQEAHITVGHILTELTERILYEM